MIEFNNGTQLKIPEALMTQRDVEGSGLSREAARAICEASGVVWGCDLLA